ncbi:nuclease-related domain-containing protein [Streptomyces sp. H27-C3]|uniref:nuclease-related domain-containing protein n=1 Tax=Streptomyces sp. H27-C3 TaxID=3046305 RepID=UPI0024B8CC23|nr:nuclease-related domain-containing protein [Streptomyces sp. H27-C3]MDJ0467042.1 nuclease-related domain-containing protein [Streptomyces sp. H27-C3]
MNAGSSAAAQAAAHGAGQRPGLWLRLLIALGVREEPAPPEAAMPWLKGAEGELATQALIDVLIGEGWTVFHDLGLPRSRSNVDHILIPPSGAGIIVLDSKRWWATWLTSAVGGRLYCGEEDRHYDAEKAAFLARFVRDVVGLVDLPVLPALVIHASAVADGGHLQVDVDNWPLPLHVFGPQTLLANLRERAGRPDPRRAARLASRVAQTTHPYVEGGS